MKENIARTDLALENTEIISTTPPGVSVSSEEKDRVKITRIKITNNEGEKAIGKPKGTYITAEVPRFTASSVLDRNTATLLSRELDLLLPKKRDLILVAGLGNTDITPDALGPLVCEKILATRHISKDLAHELGLLELKSVAVISPGVLGKTGIETREIIASTVKSISPCAVIIIDALAARNLSRLGCTVQISDSGICPGSGVGNSRAEINEKFLGVPVISLGVPTVVDAKTLVSDLTENSGEDCPDMIVTPKEIDMMINRACELISASVNLCLQPSFSLDELLGLI
ncbi:MAG: GPR endopeptidase [Clostridia bacterium]|nr:GPR endopeptidase [Clostridia bacterium]